MTKVEMAVAGEERLKALCLANKWKVPTLHTTHPGGGASCGMYIYATRTIHVHASSCAAKGYGGPAWSWPGYIIDRTPFGVYCHELGHYADDLNHDISAKLFKDSGEPAISGYAPNRAEWFAEMFRLFGTNGDLLKRIRPATFKLMTAKFTPVETRPWYKVLAGAPDRTIAMAARRITEAQ